MRLRKSHLILSRKYFMLYFGHILEERCYILNYRTLLQSYQTSFTYKEKESSIEAQLLLSGERGIRTPGGVTLNGFQDRRNRPLCHLSNIFRFLPRSFA